MIKLLPVNNRRLIIKNFIMKLKTFVENNKKTFIIVAVILFLVALVIAIVFSFFSGTVQTIGYTVGSIICVISAAMFLIIYSLNRKKKDKNKIENIPEIKPMAKRSINKNLLILALVMSISAILCFSGVFMIVLSNISAVKIAGIVIASVFGFIMMFIMVFIYLFYV